MNNTTVRLKETATTVGGVTKSASVSSAGQLVSTGYVLALTGLTNGQAVVDDFATIGFNTTPGGGTVTNKWGNAFGSSSFGTAANPSGTPAPTDTHLWLEVTRDGEVQSMRAEMLYATPVLNEPIPDKSFIGLTGVSNYELSTYVTGGGLTWTIENGPITGFSISGSVLSVDKDVTGAIANTSVTIRATNSGGFVEDTFLVSVAAASAFDPIVDASAKLGLDFSVQSTLYTGADPYTGPAPNSEESFTAITDRVSGNKWYRAGSASFWKQETADVGYLYTTWQGHYIQLRAPAAKSYGNGNDLWMIINMKPAAADGTLAKTIAGIYPLMGRFATSGSQAIDGVGTPTIEVDGAPLADTLRSTLKTAIVEDPRAWKVVRFKNWNSTNGLWASSPLELMGGNSGISGSAIAQAWITPTLSGQTESDMYSWLESKKPTAYVGTL